MVTVNFGAPTEGGLSFLLSRSFVLGRSLSVPEAVPGLNQGGLSPLETGLLSGVSRGRVGSDLHLCVYV